MRKIGFNNFRRFHDFPSLELGNISIMVGRNNSGKSTMMKAILLILDYLQNQQFNEFSFANNSLEDANIVTFGRALNNKAENKEIIFKLELDGIIFTIFIYGNDEDTNANVSKLIITDNNSNINFDINYITETLNISKSNPSITNKVDSLSIVMSEINELELEIQKPDFQKASQEGLRIVDHFNKLKLRVKNHSDILENDQEPSRNELFNLSYPLKLNLEDKTEDTILQELVSDFIYQNDAEIKKLKQLQISLIENNNLLAKTIEDLERKKILAQIDNINSKIESNLKEDQLIEDLILELVDIDNYKIDLSRSIDKAVQLIKSSIFYYLGANPSKQSALFSIRDKQNNLAQAIHDFKQSKSQKGQFVYEFVTRWMREFEVGNDFEIEFYAGEAYQFYVIDNDDSKSHLADKGMGSLQIMMLILKLATIIHKHRDRLKFITVIVEEPELNLHPEFQGKLADFFHEVNKNHGINLIIETHSEYLIRKSQNILVKESYTDDKGLNPSPFKIHYFDKEHGPYEMKYLKNGKFDRKFGEGFFDYADNLEVETYKLNLKKNN